MFVHCKGKKHFGLSGRLRRHYHRDIDVLSSRVYVYTYIPLSSRLQRLYTVLASRGYIFIKVLH